jgi:NAD-dependent deacetylase
MSAESGIATFRGDGGLWTGITKYIALPFFGTPVGWNTLTRLTWSVYIKYFYNPIAAAKPNKGHVAIGEMHKLKNVKVVTQNVDGLHQAGGSPEDSVFEVHGTVRKYKCLNNGHPYTFESTNISTTCPTCKKCGSYIRPDCVLFTESLPERDWSESVRAVQKLGKNDVMIIVGTSSTVYPGLCIVNER